MFFGENVLSLTSKGTHLKLKFNLILLKYILSKIYTNKGDFGYTLVHIGPIYHQTFLYEFTENSAQHYASSFVSTTLFPQG